MDTLVVGPRYVLRDSDFFGSEKHCLEYMLSVRGRRGRVGGSAASRAAV